MQKTLKTLKNDRQLLLMLLPAVLYFVIFNYIPILGIVITFKRYDYSLGMFGSPWVGFENFRFLFTNGEIFNVIRNTVLYNAAFIVINNSCAIAVSVILSELTNKRFKKISQSVMFVPYFVSWVVVGAFVYNMFNDQFGFINTVLKQLELPTANIYSKPVAWIGIIILMALWKNIGYSSVMYMAAIAGIDREMYEAAEIDGANIFQRIFRITIPSLTPTIIILVLLSIGNIFRGDFSMFYQIVGGNFLVYSTTDVIDTYVMRSLVQVREFGMTSAAGFIQSILCLLIITCANGVVRRVERDYALY